MKPKREQELELIIWFLKNELYSDGSNIDRWLPKLKEKIEELFEIKIIGELKK